MYVVTTSRAGQNDGLRTVLVGRLAPTNFGPSERVLRLPCIHAVLSRLFSPPICSSSRHGNRRRGTFTLVTPSSSSLSWLLPPRVISSFCSASGRHHCSCDTSPELQCGDRATTAAVLIYPP